jgi:hypothetical protein
VSRGKRTSIFGGLLGKKDKAEDKAEHKTEGESSKAELELKKDDGLVAAPVAESKFNKFFSRIADLGYQRVHLRSNSLTLLSHHRARHH